MYLVLLKMMCSDPCTDWFARLGDLFYQLFHFAMCRTPSRDSTGTTSGLRPSVSSRASRLLLVLRRSAACATSMCGASHPRCNGLGVIGGGLQYTLVDRAAVWAPHRYQLTGVTDGQKPLRSLVGGSHLRGTIRPPGTHHVVPVPMASAAALNHAPVPTVMANANGQ